jgi:hypothetical protein
MARLLLAAALLCALSAAPIAAMIQPDGPADLDRMLQCLERDGNYTTFLGLFKTSGFGPLFARHITTQPLTLLIPNDKAFTKMPAKMRSQLQGFKLIKFIEYHSILQKMPKKYLEYCKPGSFFETASGVSIHKMESTSSSTVILSPLPQDQSTPGDMAVVVGADICGLGSLTLVAHAISKPIMNANIFSSGGM